MLAPSRPTRPLVSSVCRTSLSAATVMPRPAFLSAMLTLLPLAFRPPLHITNISDVIIVIIEKDSLYRGLVLIWTPNSANIAVKCGS